MEYEYHSVDADINELCTELLENSNGILSNCNLSFQNRVTVLYLFVVLVFSP